MFENRRESRRSRENTRRLDPRVIDFLRHKVGSTNFQAENRYSPIDGWFFVVTSFHSSSIDDHQHQRRIVIHYPFLVAISREGLAAINLFTLSPIAKRNYDVTLASSNLRTLGSRDLKHQLLNSTHQKDSYKGQHCRWHGHYIHAFKY